MLIGYVHRLSFIHATAATAIYTLSLHDALPISSHSFRNRLLVICKNAYLFATMIMTSVSSPFSCCSGIVMVANKYAFLRSEERFSRNAETNLVCRLLLEKKNADEPDGIRAPVAE